MTTLTPTPVPPVAASEEEFVLQLGYASAATVEFSDDDLRELLAKSRSNNMAAGITGMLLYHEGSFLQVLEGPSEAVEHLYARIRRDKRHGNANPAVPARTQSPPVRELDDGVPSAEQ